MKLKLGMLSLVAVLLFTLTLSPMSVEAAKPTPVTFQNVTGTGTTSLGLPVNFNGTATITNFVVQNGQIVANGVLNGQITDAAGNVLATITNLAFHLPIIGSQASCTILTLDLGPLDLNLLGLFIHLDKVHLDITAHPGAGLLGDLLCAVANLLNGGNLNALSNLLNNILKILSGL